MSDTLRSNRSSIPSSKSSSGLSGKKIVLTGATGGIGQQIAKSLAAVNAKLILVSRDEKRLADIVKSLEGEHHFIAADLSTNAGLKHFRSECRALGNIDILINNAGINDFSFLENQDIEKIQSMVRINLLAPMLTCRILLPILQRQKESTILNVGSTFGSIGYPGSAVYCGSKFGLRGFTEALRRELSNTSVKVHYLSPRATRTTMNSGSVDALNHALGNAVDDPAVVVSAVLKQLKAKRGYDVFLGWPEKLFVKINGLFPKIVTQSISKQLATIRQHAFHSQQS